MNKDLAKDVLHDFSTVEKFQELSEIYNNLPMSQFFWLFQPGGSRVLSLKSGLLQHVTIHPEIKKGLK